MGWLGNTLGKFKDWVGGYDESDNNAYVNKAKEATNAVKDTQTLANEGRAAAGIAAADKAGEAKKAAKAAAMQGGGGKLAAATSGANAAANASAQGYAETANQMTGVAANQNAAKVGAISGEANALQNKAANRQNAKNTFTTNYGAPTFQQGLKNLASSDASKKIIQVSSKTGVATTNYKPVDPKKKLKGSGTSAATGGEEAAAGEAAAGEAAAGEAAAGEAAVGAAAAASDTRKKYVYIPKSERTKSGRRRGRRA
jgi:hypothetical protein